MKLSRVVLALLVVAAVSAFYLRVAFLLTIPGEMYWEEAALGVDAYSIVKTGADIHGVKLPVVAFESFGDWKPSGYFYALVPFISVLGLSHLSVVLPSLVAGLSIVIAVPLLSWLLFKDTEYAAATAVVVAISPWMVLFSRGGWEVHLATALLVWGCVLFLAAVKKVTSHWTAVAGVLLLVASMYTYHGLRVTAPLIGIGLVWYWVSQLSNKKMVTEALHQWKVVIGVSLVLLAIFLAPLAKAITDPMVTARFAQTNLFGDLSVLQESVSAQEQVGSVWWSKIVFHRYWYFGRAIFTQFLRVFSVQYLFISGDSNPRHSAQYVGELYMIEVIAVFIGVSWVFLRKRSEFLFGLWWVFVATLPMALTNLSPHSLRMLPAVPMILIAIAVGWVEGVRYLKTVSIPYIPKKMVVLFGVLCIVGGYSVQLGQWWRYYTKNYTVLHGNESQYGYKQMVDKVVTLEKQYPQYPVYISRYFGRPSVYYWFYTKTDPMKIQSESEKVPLDQGELLQFENKVFFDKAQEIVSRPAIMAMGAREYKDMTGNDLSTLSTDALVYDQKGEAKWVVYLLE